MCGVAFFVASCKGVLAIAMDDESLDGVQAAVQAGVEKAGKKWKAKKWDGFVCKVVWWLLKDKKRTMMT